MSEKILIRGRAIAAAAVALVAAVAFGEPTGCPDFTVDLPRAKKGLVQAKDFGLSTATSNNAAAITAALREAKRRGAGRVVLERGTFYCHDARGVVAEGLEDVTIDGKGATLVFCRPSDFHDQPQWDNSHDGANFILRDCRRVLLTNISLDWDWEKDPLGEFVTVVDTHLGAGDTFESYLDLRFDDYRRHPLYGRPLPVQTLYTADESRERLGVGENNYFGQSEGHFGCKMKWLTPNRIRIWPYAKSDCGPFSTQYESRLEAKRNHWAVSRRKVGDFLRLAHYYYGKNCFVVEDGEHLTFRKVDVLSCRGMGWLFDGTLHHVAVVDCNVLPPHRLGRAAKGPAKRPFTTTADVVHVSRGSRGYFKFENYRAAMNQDDLYNFHDRSSWAKKTGARELTVTQQRGLKYFGPQVGDELELLGKDFSTTGFRARIMAIGGETMTVDRDVPDRFLAESIVFDRARDTGHVILRNCVHEGPSGRCCVLAPNVTIDGLVIRDSQGQALKLQSGTTTDKWSEGYGCTNVVVRNCVFADVNGRLTKMYGVVSDVFVGVNFENGRETGVKPVDTLVSDILLENNTFVRPRGEVFHVRGASKVVERGNRVIRADFVPEVKFERQSLGDDVKPVPQIAPFSWEAKDGLLWRNGKPDYWIGNGSDLGSSQATPLGLWLAWLQGSKMVSVTHSTTRFKVTETNGALVVRGDLRPSAVPWLREAIRLGFLTQAPDGFFRPEGSAWQPFLAKYPALREFVYDCGHHMGADAATPIGRATLVEKRAPLFSYGDRTGCFLPELNREPGPDPYSERVKRGFRAWAEKKYGTLAEANGVWKTKFATWADVVLRHTVEGAPNLGAYKGTPDDAERQILKMRGVRTSLRQLEAQETPELYMDWILYVQEDSHAALRGEFDDVRQMAPRSLPGMDLRAHQSSRDNYVEYDPTVVDKLEDIFYIHFVFKATDYGNRPMNDRALADLICWPLFECKYFRSVATKPIVNSEDIITQTVAAAPSREAMAENDLADFAHAKWTLRPNNKGGVSFTCEFTVPKRYQNDLADGSRRFYLCGYKNAPGVWFNLNGKPVPGLTFMRNFYQLDISQHLRFGERNVLKGSLRSETDATKRPDCFVLAQDMLGAFSPFGEKQYTAMFWSYLMNAHSSAIVWNWNAHEKLRLWEAGLARKLSAAAEIALPDLRHRRNDVAFLYGYTGGLGLPSPREGRHCRLMAWAGALEFSGHRFDAIGEEEFQAFMAVRPRADYQVVVAPDQALVKDETVAAAKRFVEAGGRLIVTPTTFEKTFSRYRKTDFAAFAAAHSDRVVVIDGEPSTAELAARLAPLLPKPTLDVTFDRDERSRAQREFPCVERVLAGDRTRKVLYLQNWGGLDHTATVTLPEACRDWKVTPLHGTFDARDGKVTTTVAGSLGVSAAILTAPGVEPPSFTLSPVRERVIAKVRELNELANDANGQDARSPRNVNGQDARSPRNVNGQDARSPRNANGQDARSPKKKRVLFPKDMLAYHKQGELSSDTICGKEIYPYLLDRAKAFGYEVDELEPVKWTAEVLSKYDLVMMLCARDNQQWTPIATDKAHLARFQKAIDAYVKNGGSLFCQIYSGLTSCANMAMTWSLTPALWKFKCGANADPQDAAHCGFGDPRQILTDNVARHAITEGVRSVQLGAANPILRLKGCALEPLVSFTETASASAGAPVMAAEEYGKGRLFVNFEPMAFQPFRIEHADNAALLENVFGWLSHAPVTAEMREEFRRNLFLTEADLRQIAADEK